MSGLYDTPRRTFTVRFEPSGITAEAPEGRVLMAVMRAADVHLEAPCGGQGWCGRCRVVAEGELSPPAPDELRLLSPNELAHGVRLACRARVAGDVVVRLPETGGMRIAEAPGDVELEVEQPEARGLACLGERCLGAAVDIGTTTLAVALIDLRSGERLATASARNPQTALGADVMSRISHAVAMGPSQLQALVAEEIERLVLGSLVDTGAEACDLAEICVAGNTTMTSLLLAVDVAPLAVAPYEPAFVAPTQRLGEDLGMRELTAARVVTVPGVSAFVGGDVVGGLLATALAEREEPTLLVDLGTNGEVVLAAGGRLFACSTAAGPALEGASISSGMLAVPGAIERVERRGNALSLQTIGRASPQGICGSGLLDLIAELLGASALDPTGRLVPEGVLAARIEEAEDGRRFRVDDAGDVYLTQQDVRQVQLAKGAVAAGVDLLLAEAGVSAEDVAEVVIAGGFGLHVRPSALTRIGMLPKPWTDRVSFVGNSSLTGAAMLLASSRLRAEAHALAARVRTIDLAAHPEFQTRFIGALEFPAG